MHWMKHISLLSQSMAFLLVAGFTANPLIAHAATPRTIHKLVIVALARDRVRAAEVEASVKQDLIEHGINADSLLRRDLVGQSAPRPFPVSLS